MTGLPQPVNADGSISSWWDSLFCFGSDKATLNPCHTARQENPKDPQFHPAPPTAPHSSRTSGVRKWPSARRSRDSRTGSRRKNKGLWRISENATGSLSFARPRRDVIWTVEIWEKSFFRAGIFQLMQVRGHCWTFLYTATPRTGWLRQPRYPSPWRGNLPCSAFRA